MSIEEEATRRRVTVLSSHLNPTRFTYSDPLSASLCSAASDSDNDNNNCVFCNIIRGQSPAVKVLGEDENNVKVNMPLKIKQLQEN